MFKFNLGPVNKLSHSLSISLLLTRSFYFFCHSSSTLHLTQTHKPVCLSADTLLKKPADGRLLWELAAWQLAGLATCPSVARAVLSVAAKCRASCVRLDVDL